MVCSSIDEDVVYATDGFYVYKTEDGGILNGDFDDSYYRYLSGKMLLLLLLPDGYVNIWLLKFSRSLDGEEGT